MAKAIIRPYRFAEGHDLGPWSAENEIRIVMTIVFSRGSARRMNDLFDRWMRTLAPDLDSDLSIERAALLGGCALERTNDAGGNVDFVIRSGGADGVDLAASRYIDICDIVRANDPDADVSYAELWRTPRTVEEFRRTRQEKHPSPDWVRVAEED